MKKDELKSILLLLTTAFPQFQVTPTTEMLWMSSFGHRDQKLVQAAVLAWVNQRSYPPTIADLQEKIHTITHKDEGFDAALKLVNELVSRHGSYGEAEALAEMPPKLQGAMQAFGWRSWCLCPTSQLGTARAQLRAIYETSAHKIKQLEVLPPSVAKLVENVARTTIGDSQNRLLEARGEKIEGRLIQSYPPARKASV